MNNIIIQCEQCFTLCRSKPKTQIQVQDEPKKEEVRTLNF